MNRLRSLPIHPIAFAGYSVVALLAQNIAEVHYAVAVRPLIFSVAVALGLMAILRAVIGSWSKPALITSLMMAAFFVYGHIYELVRNATILDVVIGRHRYLLPFLSVLVLIGILLIVRTSADLERPTQILNVVAIALLLIPMVQLVSFAVETRAAIQGVEEAEMESAALNYTGGDSLPDIYFIVLDTYTREDALKSDLAFDNSSFTEALEERGFYVADCARANYGDTRLSLASVLGLSYPKKPDSSEMDSDATLDEAAALLRRSQVRRLLEEAGYKTVAFETGYEWTTLRDADFFLSVNMDPLTLQHLDPFEEMLLNTTALRVIADLEAQQFQSRMRDIDDVVSVSEFPLAPYVERQLFIFDQLPEIAELTDPTFAFVHITTPHSPYVFDSDGNIWTDEGFYYGASKEPIDEWHLIKGYTSAIEFTNKRILESIDQILERSKSPPVIIMQGDHGLRDENRLEILSAYFLPRSNSELLYPSISPVNSFRVVFDSLFGTDFGLLEDLSFSVGSSQPQPEGPSDCRQGTFNSPSSASSR